MPGTDSPQLSPQVIETQRRYVAPELAVVVPAFNERDNIEPLYEKLALALGDIPFEMIVVDDDSPDGTSHVVRELGQIYHNVRCIRRFGRRGLSSACVEGVAASVAPFVAVMDADLQHDEAILPQMLAKLKSGSDLVIGSRFAGQGSAEGGLSKTRLRGSQFATRLAHMLTGQGVTDPMSGFFMLRRDTFERVAPKLSNDGFKVLLDLIVTSSRSGHPLAIAEVPYSFRERQAGESKMNSLVVLQFLGLWFSQVTGGFLPPSFLLFAMIGASGVFVHLAVLWTLVEALHQPFILGQVVATLVAMTWNFFLNNTLTYANKRLHGRKLVTGLLGFYAICSLGGIANVSVANMIYQDAHVTLLAGIAGAVMSSVFNYAVTRIFTWR